MTVAIHIHGAAGTVTGSCHRLVTPRGTLRAITPTVSQESEFAQTPRLGIRLYVGLKAITPQYPAGRMSDPNCCVPVNTT